MGLGLSSVLDVDDDEFEVLCMDAFKRYDDDDSGSLELPEILEAFKSLPALSHATEDVVVAKFKKFDADNSGALDAEEFMELMKQLRAEKTMSRMMEVGEEEFEKLLQESFKKFDDDNSGELELDEIIAAFDLLPLTEVSEDDVRAKFTRFDADHSGALDFEEFTELMRELRAQDAKAASVKKVRLDAAERRIIRNLVSMAEVKLCKLVPRRERACAKILAWVNNAKIQDVADLMRGMSKTGSAVNLKGMNARDTPEPPTPRARAGGASERGGDARGRPVALPPRRRRRSGFGSRSELARVDLAPAGAPPAVPRPHGGRNGLQVAVQGHVADVDAGGERSHLASRRHRRRQRDRRAEGARPAHAPQLHRDVRVRSVHLRAVGGDASDAAEPGGADRGHAVGRLRVRAVGPGDAFARRHLVVSVHAERSGRGRWRRGWRTRGDGSGGPGPFTPIGRGSPQ